MSSPTEIAGDNRNGASFRGIGAMYQKDPRRIVSLAGKPRQRRPTPTTETRGDPMAATVGIQLDNVTETFTRGAGESTRSAVSA
ncbi:hypothetical protein GCM10027445_52290 [Amycolatopsis endophytica]